MIKSILIMLICLSFATVASAQQKDLKDPRYKKYAGRYGSSSGVVLFDDGTYLLYGYATVVFGTYRFENDQLFFSADHQDEFEVFAHRNTTLTEGARINFIGFERGGRTFVQLGSDSIRPVFNSDANCFDAPFVYMNAGKMQRFTMAVVPPDFSKVNAAADTSWAYANKAGYNDFIFVHHATRREDEDFVAVVLTTEKGEVMKLSSFGGEQGYLKQKEDMNNREMLDMKSEYDRDKGLANGIIYANQHYKIFPAPEASRYTYDVRKNLYTSRDAEENASRYMQDQYNDPSHLRQYQKLAPQAKSKFKPDATRPGQSLFFTVCGEGADRSYHYDGFIEYKIPHQETPALQPAEPQKLQE